MKKCIQSIGCSASSLENLFPRGRTDMARRLLPELKAKILESLRDGKSVESVALTFGVAKRTVYYLLQQLKSEHGTRRKFRIARINPSTCPSGLYSSCRNCLFFVPVGKIVTTRLIVKFSEDRLIQPLLSRLPALCRLTKGQP